MSRSSFSPIKDVIREAEDRAIAEWDREHKPCPHEGPVFRVYAELTAFCADCKAKIEG